MRGRICSALIALTAAAAFAAPPATQTITVQVVDGRTGDKLTPDNIEIRADRDRTVHTEWVKLNGDGTATVTLPAKVTAISVHASYDNSTEYYINCDVSRQKDVSQDTWFPVTDVLSQGLVMPSECGRARNAKDMKIEAKPGEFVLLVRKRGLMDRVGEMR
ncbi:MAG TPA: hypothetical protein VG893_06430 [Terracidiphilus sp.]|nr:hypothetical protein [Terracidiphilus sp.]